MLTEQAIAEKPAIAEEPEPERETLSVSEASDWVILRPKRAKLTPEESLRRMQAFSERKEQFIAAVTIGN